MDRLTKITAERRMNAARERLKDAESVDYDNDLSMAEALGYLRAHVQILLLSLEEIMEEEK
jgi:hypothetical protein